MKHMGDGGVWARELGRTKLRLGCKGGHWEGLQLRWVRWRTRLGGHALSWGAYVNTKEAVAQSCWIFWAALPPGILVVGWGWVLCIAMSRRLGAQLGVVLGLVEEHERNMRFLQIDWRRHADCCKACNPGLSEEGEASVDMRQLLAHCRV